MYDYKHFAEDVTLLEKVFDCVCQDFTNPEIIVCMILSLLTHWLPLKYVLLAFVLPLLQLLFHSMFFCCKDRTICDMKWNIRPLFQNMVFFVKWIYPHWSISNIVLHDILLNIRIKPVCLFPEGLVWNVFKIFLNGSENVVR